MKKLLFLLMLFSFISTAQAQYNNRFFSQQWLPTQLKYQQNTQQLNAKATNKATFTIDFASLAQLTSTNKSFLIDLPLPNGEFTQFKLTSSPVMSKELAEKYPSIQTLTGFQVQNPNHL